MSLINSKNRIRIVRQGNLSEEIGSQLSKVEDDGNFAYEISTSDMGELNQEQWLRVAGIK